MGTGLRLCTEGTYLLSRGQVETGRGGEDTLVSLVSDIEFRLQHGDMDKYMTERRESTLSCSMGTCLRLRQWERRYSLVSDP